MARNSVRVLIATRLNKVVQQILQEADIEFDVREDYTPEELLDIIGNYHGIVVRSEPVDSKTINAGNNLMLVVRAGSGVNTIDVKAATEKNILVMNTPDANSNAVAELVFGLMLAAYRNIPKADSSVKSGLWLKKDLMGNELSGKTLGIVGLGAIGGRLVPKAKAFDMKIIAHDPFLAPEKARQIGVQATTLEEVCRRSDFLTLHIPLNPNTKEIITYDLLKLLPDGAMIINAARAEVIAKGALEKILEERPTLRAASDVFVEGDKQGEKSLARFGDRVVLTPHLGASTKDANYRAARMSASQMVDYFKKGVISYPVNLVHVPAGLDFKYMELAKKIGFLAYHFVQGAGQVAEIRITCYGTLYNHTDLLTKSAISGVMDSYLEEVVAPILAESLAEQNGIKVTKREPDDMKGHGNSITLDVVAEDKAQGKISETSIRGTISQDGDLMIRRIDKFENVDVLPEGSLVMFTYEDRKGISGYIGEEFSKRDINILDGRYKTSSDNLHAIAVLKTDRSVEQQLLEDIHNHIKANRSFNIDFSKF